jgi:hypothetical protein
MIPHGIDQGQRIGQGWPLADRFGLRIHDARQSMASGAAAPLEGALATPGVSRLFKKARGVKECHQILRGLLVQLAGRDLTLAHGSPHGGCVVPHRSRE